MMEMGRWCRGGLCLGVNYFVILADEAAKAAKHAGWFVHFLN